MEMKPGYKQTEVGIIPEDWEVKPLSSLSTEIGDGIHSTPNYVKSSEFHFVNGNNLVTDRISITDNTMCVSEAEYKKLRKNLSDRTLLLSINGTIGNLAFYKGEQVVLGKSAAYISVAKDVSRRFISYCLKNRPTALYFDNELTGTTIRNLSLQSLRNTPIPLPPTLPEQRAIATALSDADAWIESLEQLIAKKRQIKQGAMQELLTGKRRLPGFKGAWELVKAGSIGRFQGGSGFPIKFQGATSGEFPLYKVSDMNNSGNETFMENANNYISESLRKQIGATAFPAKCIVFAKVGAAVFLERKKILTKPSCLDNNMAAFIMDASRCDCRFLHYVLLSTKLGSLVSTTALPSLSGSVLASIELRLPPLCEQSAIAVVLSDMDTEITALESKLTKARQIKQGMMQELLTGRIRLI